MKSKGTAYLLWCGCFFGLAGLHRFYIGKIGTGLIWFFTLGLLGIGQLIDLFTLSGQVDMVNMKSGAGQNVSQNVVVNVQSGSDQKGAEPSEKLQEIMNKKTSERLTELKKLKEGGLITPEEYDEKRRDIIART